MYRRRKVQCRHALRLTPQRMKAIRRLHAAGPDGVPEVLAHDVGLLLAWDIAELFDDGSRVLSSRIRLSPYGERIATTLAFPKESP